MTRLLHGTWLHGVLAWGLTILSALAVLFMASAWVNTLAGNIDSIRIVRLQLHDVETRHTVLSAQHSIATDRLAQTAPGVMSGRAATENLQAGTQSIVAQFEQAGFRRSGQRADVTLRVHGPLSQGLQSHAFIGPSAGLTELLNGLVTEDIMITSLEIVPARGGSNEGAGEPEKAEEVVVHFTHTAFEKRPSP